MAQKPDGKPAKTERVAFTRPAAERIAKVVRHVESGNREGRGLYFGNAASLASTKSFRVCTFTGSLSIGTPKIVTFKNVTATPNTVSAENLFWTAPAPTAATDCGIAKDGTAWHLVCIPCIATTGIQVKQIATYTALASVSVGATLNTNDCTISTLVSSDTFSFSAVSLTTAATFIKVAY